MKVIDPILRHTLRVLRPLACPGLPRQTGLKSYKIDDLAGQLLAGLPLQGHMNTPIGALTQHSRSDSVAVIKYLSLSA